MPMKKYILIILLLLGILGCGLRLTYPNLDWLIPWYVDDYISLNQEQRSILEQRLMRALNWHCHTQLPAYAQMLKVLANELDDPRLPLSVGRLYTYAGQVQRHWRDIKIQIGPEIAMILVSASDEQIVELLENIEQRNNAFKTQYVDISLDKLDQKRRKKMIMHVDRWFSEITPVQKQAVDDWSAAIRPLAADGLEYRQRITAELRRMLARRKDDPDFTDAFVDLLVNVDQHRSAEYQKKIDANMDLTADLLVKIDRSLTPKQRSYLLKRLHALAADFEKLSCNPAVAHLSIQESIEAI
jgi:disulfide oxidoreductase YuzD